MYFKSVACKKKTIVLKSLDYNRVLFSLNISITREKIYKPPCFLESTFYAIHKKIPREKKSIKKKLFSPPSLIVKNKKKNIMQMLMIL